MSITQAKQLKAGDDKVEGFLHTLSTVSLEQSNYLLLLTGSRTKKKLDFVQKLASKLNTEVTAIDMDDVLAGSVSESLERIDGVLSGLDPKDKVLYIHNGDFLTGSYSGNTNSKVHYATPHQRQFLNKIQKIEKVVIVDMHNADNIDKMMARMSHFRIDF